MTAAPTEERGDAVALGRRGIRSLCMRRAIRRNRPLAMLVASIFTYRLAGAMLVVALPFFAVHRFGFGVGAGLVLGARLLPNVLFGLVVGHLVDRWEPRRTAWVTAVLNGALVALVPLAGSRGAVQALLFASGLTYLFGFPARMALRPLVIGPGEEVAGNAFIVTAERLASVAGPAAVGVAIATGGIDRAFVALGIISAAAGLLMLRLPARPPQPEEEPLAAGLRADVRRMLVTGPATLVRVIRADPMLRVLVVTAFSYVTAAAIGELLIVALAREQFADLPGANGWLVGAMGAGGVAGALLSAPLARAHPGRLYLAGNVLEALAWLVLPRVHWLPLALAVMALAGMLESAATVVYFAEVQRRLPAGLTGRFYASFVPLTDACAMAGSILGPAVIGSAGVGRGAGVIAALIGLPVLAFTIPLLAAGPDRLPADPLSAD
jgi:ENTS family enterobactin (siderophore) exporter